MGSAQQTIAAAHSSALDSNGYIAIVTGTGSANSGFLRDPNQLRQTLGSIRATPFAAQGARAHNFDLIGTYASLADYASRMSKLPGRRLLVLFSPGFSSDFPEIRSAAAAAMDRIVQSGVVLNALNTQDPSSGSFGEDNMVLEELSSSSGGSIFLGPISPLCHHPLPRTTLPTRHLAFCRPHRRLVPSAQGHRLQPRQPSPRPQELRRAQCRPIDYPVRINPQNLC